MELKEFKPFLDLSSMNEEERSKYIESLKLEAEICNLTQDVAKLTLNSIYGALANEYFHWFRVELAEAVTLQGQHAIKFSEKLINHYFRNIFPTDYELHEKLGITITKPIVIKDDIVRYCDTDSWVFDTLHKIEKPIVEIETDEKTFQLDSNHPIQILRDDQILVVCADEIVEGEIVNGEKIKKITHKKVFIEDTIENIFESEKAKLGSSFDGKNEVVDLRSSNLRILNRTSDNKIDFDKMEFLLRHKVDKILYTVKDLDYGKSITITADHSLILKRDGRFISGSVLDLQFGDKILINDDGDLKEVWNFVIEEFGTSEKPVYDISVSPIKANGEYYDHLCSLFGNDILIHNSNYCSFQEVRDVIGWKGSNKELILSLYENKLKEYLKDSYKKYVDELNGMGYYLDFELETISDNGIWLAKKKYCHNIVWQDGVDIEPLSKLKFTGIEIIQSSTPLFARQNLKDLVKKIFSVKRFGEEDFPDFAETLLGLKKSFKIASIDSISVNNNISDYKKFIEDDEDDLVILPHCPIHVKAAAIHNFLLHKHGLKNKYDKITNGDRVKWYYTDNIEFPVFGFISGSFPDEFAIPIDYERQFERVIINPINRIIAPTGCPELDSNLYYSGSLY